MGKIDQAKETIGYLKLIFGVLVAIDVSLIGYMFQHGDASTAKLFVVIVTIVCVTGFIVFINRKILVKIDELKDL